MSERLSRIVPMFVSLFVFVLLAVGIHEQGHYLMANHLGVPTWVSFFLMGGTTWYQNPATGALVEVTLYQDMMIGLFGGFFAGAAFAVLWLVNHWQSWFEKGALDEVFLFGAMWVSQWIYAVGEGIEKWAPLAPYWSQPIGVALAVLGVMALYGKRLLDWWEGVRTPLLSQIDPSIPETDVVET